MKQYSYPLDIDWSTEEVVQVVDFFQYIEKTYESSARSEDILTAYRSFKKVVPSKSEEKTLFKQFEQQTGYVPYKVVKKAEQEQNGQISIQK